MPTIKWTTANIPDQTGRIAIVTGSNSGIGFEAACALAHAGATVIVCSRSLEKCFAAVDRILAETPSGIVTPMHLDLGDLDNVADFVAAFSADHDSLDLLINNAGAMRPPFGQTAQGFERRFGVNHLGHFALTGHLINLLMDTPNSRIVTIASLQHLQGEIDFDDLNGEKGDNQMRAYSQSKLANVIFTLELQRRLASAGSSTIAAACHPGWANTHFEDDGFLMRNIANVFAQSAEQGALPTLRAATDPAVQGGDYYGPHRWRGLVGHPVEAKINPAAHDEAVAAKLWEVSEDLTGVSYLS